MERKELAGQRWADVADQAPAVYAVWGGGATPAQALSMVGSFSRRRQRPPSGELMAVMALASIKTDLLRLDCEKERKERACNNPQIPGSNQ